MIETTLPNISSENILKSNKAFAVLCDRVWLVQDKITSNWAVYLPLEGRYLSEFMYSYFDFPTHKEPWICTLYNKKISVRFDLQNLCVSKT